MNAALYAAQYPEDEPMEATSAGGVESLSRNLQQQAAQAATLHQLNRPTSLPIIPPFNPAQQQRVIGGNNLPIAGGNANANRRRTSITASQTPGNNSIPVLPPMRQQPAFNEGAQNALLFQNLEQEVFGSADGDDTSERSSTPRPTQQPSSRVNSSNKINNGYTNNNNNMSLTNNSQLPMLMYQQSVFADSEPTGYTPNESEAPAGRNNRRTSRPAPSYNAANDFFTTNNRNSAFPLLMNQNDTFEDSFSPPQNTRTEEQPSNLRNAPPTPPDNNNQQQQQRPGPNANNQNAGNRAQRDAAAMDEKKNKDNDNKDTSSSDNAKKLAAAGGAAAAGKGFSDFLKNLFRRNPNKDKDEQKQNDAKQQQQQQQQKPADKSSGGSGNLGNNDNRPNANVQQQNAPSPPPANNLPAGSNRDNERNAANDNANGQNLPSERKAAEEKKNQQSPGTTRDNDAKGNTRDESKGGSSRPPPASAPAGAAGSSGSDRTDTKSNTNQGGGGGGAPGTAAKATSAAKDNGPSKPFNFKPLLWLLLILLLVTGLILLILYLAGVIGKRKSSTSAAGTTTPSTTVITRPPPTTSQPVSTMPVRAPGTAPVASPTTVVRGNNVLPASTTTMVVPATQGYTTMAATGTRPPPVTTFSVPMVQTAPTTVTRDLTWLQQHFLGNQTHFPLLYEDDYAMPRIRKVLLGYQPSAMECAVLCFERQDCIGYVWNRKTKIGHLYKLDWSSTTEAPCAVHHHPYRDQHTAGHHLNNKNSHCRTGVDILPGTSVNGTRVNGNDFGNANARSVCTCTSSSLKPFLTFDTRTPFGTNVHVVGIKRSNLQPYVYNRQTFQEYFDSSDHRVFDVPVCDVVNSDHRAGVSIPNIDAITAANLALIDSRCVSMGYFAQQQRCNLYYKHYSQKRQPVVAGFYPARKRRLAALASK
jgi:hypothetical protein